MNIYNVLRIEEGFRVSPYYCSEGYPTIGIGTRIGTKNADLSLYQFTVNQEISEAMIRKDVLANSDKLCNLTWYCTLNEARRAIIQSMCYQLGFNGLMKFKKMISAIKSGYWQEASDQALDSRWAKQTPERAQRHARVLKGECIDSVYKYAKN